MQSGTGQSKDSLIDEFLSQEITFKDMGLSIHALLSSLLRKRGIESHSISYRVKDKTSLSKKIDKKNKYTSLRDITDILGFRIVTFYSTDIDEIEKLIREEFEVDKENSIDKRKSIEPDRFGYMSLHYIVSLKEGRTNLPEYEGFKNFKFEVQIRTILQHGWAEIEHKLGYKSSNSMPDEIRRSFSILSGTLELVDKEFINIKNQIINYDEVTRQNIKKNKTNNTSINERSLAIFIEVDRLLNEVYESYVEKAKGINFSTREPLPNASFGEHYKDNVSDLKLLGFKTLHDINSAIKELDVHKTLSVILKYQEKVDNCNIYYADIFLVFLIYISYLLQHGDIKPIQDTNPEYNDFVEDLKALIQDC
ncbi:hypothetical protein R9X49_03715 [Pectobacterium carotovorum]|uniref:GTP pyrophosphokinase n=1 Tax=Pectobacterium carotovorum TaxID=554 RepID=UPI0029DD4117|nr:hypothetical protein [Pectobacterium carotovorum]MDX6914206.1 hypothetical protein [Pectobacterium carotovorum]